MEHAGESGVHFSVGERWKQMVIKQQLQVPNLAASLEGAKQETLQSPT